ncbi:NAD(P)/FAD-dependent oxidoreductase [Nocardia sp. NPDC003482]
MTADTAPTGPEHVDAVVVGARCAGSATATALARAGRRVVALDRARFPSETLSTHLLFPGAVAELRALGALDRAAALGAPRLTATLAALGGHEVRGTYSPADGIDYGMCVRRTGLDAALVASAREAGAEIREQATVLELCRDADGRVNGVCYRDRHDRVREVRAPLVVGADGRRSLVARHVGADRPYRRSPSGRACFFGYWRDRDPSRRHIAAMWRVGPELGTAFPCDDGLVLVLLQPPVERAREFRGNLTEEYLRTVAAIAPLAERLDGCELVGRIRSATDIESYFRRATGPGWALPGDAGHFKDPVTAQGIRDALRFGRLLGEAAAPVLSDAAALDRALVRWERRRERECLETYQWTNQLARGESPTPLEVELYRAGSRSEELARRMSDVYARTIAPGEVLGAANSVRLLVGAVTHRDTDLRRLAGTAVRDIRGDVLDRAERFRAAWSPLPPLPNGSGSGATGSDAAAHRAAGLSA